MPIFDYACDECDTEVERLVKSSAEVVLCTKCGREMYKLVSGNVSFRLYGEGFYRRNHRDAGEFS